MNTPNKKRFTHHGGDRTKAAPLKGMLTVSPKELRLQLGLTQGEFWAPAGVSQSGGSRYESGRKLPPAISALLHLVHIEMVNVQSLRGDDVRVGAQLREDDPAHYEALLKLSLKR